MTVPSLPETRRIAGIVTTRELLAARLTDRRISTLARHGDLHQVGRGVYADGPKARRMLKLPDGQQLLRLAGAVAVVGPSAVVSHESAADPAFDRPARQARSVRLTVPVQRGWTARAGVRLHAATVPPEQVTTVVGLPVTTPARTVADLARTLEFRAGVVTADSALHRKLVTRPDLTAVLLTCALWRGATAAALLTARQLQRHRIADVAMLLQIAAIPLAERPTLE